MRFISPSRLMGFYAVANMILVSIGVFFPGWVGIWCIFLTSFFMSLMFPTIFALGLKGLGPNTKLGGSFLVLAIVGGAVLTPIMGLISDKLHSYALAYSVPFLAYIYISLYSFLGSQRADITPALAASPRVQPTESRTTCEERFGVRQLYCRFSQRPARLHIWQGSIGRKLIFVCPSISQRKPLQAKQKQHQIESLRGQ